MARNIPEERRLYRGTTSQHSTYTGPQGEVTVDTSKNTVVVQDGATAGGHPLAKDSEVVHNTGTETIAGVKTFTSNVKLLAGAPALILQQNDIVKGTPPDEQQYAGISFVDNEGVNESNRLGRFRTNYSATGDVQVQIFSYAPVNGSTVHADLNLIYPASGSPYAEAPTPSDANDSSTKIATTAWVTNRISDIESNAVMVTGNQTVAGVKTFTSAPVVISSGPGLSLQQNDIVKGVAPDENQYAAIKFVDSEGSAVANRMSLLESGYRASSASVLPGASYTAMATYEPVHGSETYAAIFLYYPVDGGPYATAPTPPDADDNSIKIATTAWVQALVADKIATLESTITALEARIAALEEQG